MEPGHEGREEEVMTPGRILRGRSPQWSPAMKAGKSTDGQLADSLVKKKPQWSPAMKAGKSARADPTATPRRSRRNGARP